MGTSDRLNKFANNNTQNEDISKMKKEKAELLKEKELLKSQKEKSESLVNEKIKQMAILDKENKLMKDKIKELEENKEKPLTINLTEDSPKGMNEDIHGLK